MTLFLDFDITKFQLFTSVSVFVGTIYLLTKINKTFHSLLVFAWACFVKPIFHKAKTSNVVSTNTNQLALELFYKNQAHIYDNTRKFLLKGRSECLNIAVNHLSKRKELVWIDIGGGTGSNIESMDLILPINKFKAVYLVDLSPSLCAVARERFAKRGWTNVHVMEADACDFQISENYADLITFSYSLSMIPTFNSAIDHAVKLLDKQGIIAAVDFGIQNSDTSMGRINTLGGLVGRNYPWIIRNFWRVWFEADKVFLDSSRRNYLEYKFGTLKSLNCYNNSLGKIPYYIWIGCDVSKSTQILHRVNCLATESPYLAPAETQVSGPVSKGHEAALINLKKNLPFPSIYYQKQICRVYYDELNPLFDQFADQYIYAFTWEDPREDHNILNFNNNDTVLAITSAGDNILHYASLPNPPKRIHAVDLNPAQNHLLELKLACFRSLNHDQTWKIFGEGRIANFDQILMNKLACHMSSQAFQYWMDKGEQTFNPKGRGLYNTGFSRWALRLARWVFAAFGVTKDIENLCKASTMEQQMDIWNNKIKNTLFNPVVSTLLVGNPIFLWKALGVPANQAKMMGDSVFKYVVETLNPIVTRSLISKDNYFYYLALMGKYAYNNCPEYLTVKGFNRLSVKGTSSPIDNIRIHTDTLNDVFDRLKEKSLTIAIIMDHMDWFQPGGKDAVNEITALKNCLAPGGRVMLRSASPEPWYISTFEELGFECEAAGVRLPGESIDRVNMYASTWVCTKTVNEPSLGRRRMSSLKI